MDLQFFLTRAKISRTWVNMFATQQVYTLSGMGLLIQAPASQVG